MRRMLMAGGLAVAMAMPAIADAQTKCERDRSTNRAVGTAVGAAAGALLGSAIAGNSSNTAGTIVGGVAGGVAGNQIAKRRGEPCPTGYYETPTTGPAPGPSAGPGYGPGPGEFWSSAPAGIHERIDYMANRIDRAEQRGNLTRREARRAREELNDVRRMEASLRQRGGGRLTAPDREYVQARLDDVGRNVRWMRQANAGR